MQKKLKTWIFKRIGNFLKESWQELKRVSWPTKDKVFESVLMVILITVIVAIYLGLWDAVFTFLRNKFL
jgi:preprotein translocase subunit SecE